MRLSDFITENLEPITREWEAFAETLIPKGEKVDRVMLRDHVKGMLETIAADLACPQNSYDQAEKSKGHRPVEQSPAALHGKGRQATGFSLISTMAEFRALRASVTRLWQERHLDQPAGKVEIEDLIRFNEAIDQAISESVVTYSVAKEQQARVYETILSSTPDLAFTFDLDGRVAYANEALIAALDLPLDQILGKSFAGLGMPNAADLERRIQQVSRTKQPYSCEINHLTLSGATVWHEYIYVPVLNGEGVVEAIAGTARDITERKLADAEIRRLNVGLEQRIWERTAELERSNDALLHSNAELRHFAHATAHDLRTPLRSIVSFAQLLQQSLDGCTDNEAKDYSTIVIDNARRLETLIENLLAYASLEAQGLPFEPVDLQALVGEVVESLSVLIRETGAQVHWAGLPTVTMDHSQIAQVFQNLIENGIKYNHAKPPRVSIAGERQEDQWVFSVTDNGIGIDPRHHERIFEIFRRLHTYREVQGAGIGLALCRRIIERHGGHIWVESRPGKGSSFYFTLPIRNTTE